jgi:hypothetical protein
VSPVDPSSSPTDRSADPPFTWRHAGKAARPVATRAVAYRMCQV